MASASHETGGAFSALHAVARDYLDGMMYADEAKLRRAFHPKCLVVGHFRGKLEQLPVANSWADVVISNGVLNLCADKRQVFSEIRRILRPGGHVQFADIANGKPVPAAAIANIDLWTA